MPTLAEVYGYEDERTSRRLYLVMALALVLAGAVVFSVGATRAISAALVASGTSAALADRVAVLAGALLPPTLLTCVAAALVADRTSRLIIAVGAVLSVWGALGFLFAFERGWPFAVAAVFYAAGVLLVVTGIGRGVAGPLLPSKRSVPERIEALWVRARGRIGRRPAGSELSYSLSDPLSGAGGDGTTVAGGPKPSRPAAKPLPTDGGERDDELAPLVGE